MWHYRLYTLNQNNHITDGFDLEHPDDRSAMLAAEAHAQAQGCRVELWCGKRRIGRVEKPEGTK